MPHLSHLLARVFDRTGIVDYVIRGFDLLCVGQLRCHAARNFFARSFKIYLLPRGKACHPLLLVACHNYEPVEMLASARLQNQRSLDDSDSTRILPAHLLHPRILTADNDWMHDAVEFFDSRCELGSRSLCWTKRSLGQFLAVDTTVAIEDLAAKMAHHFVIDCFPRLHERVRDAVRLHQARAQRHKHLS